MQIDVWSWEQSEFPQVLKENDTRQVTRQLTKPLFVCLWQVSIKNFISPHPTYTCLLPLRCLLLKENNAEKWGKLLELQSRHSDGNFSDQSQSDNLEGVEKFIPR